MSATELNYPCPYCDRWTVYSMFDHKVDRDGLAVLISAECTKSIAPTADSAGGVKFQFPCSRCKTDTTHVVMDHDEVADNDERDHDLVIRARCVECTTDSRFVVEVTKLAADND